VAAVAAVYKLRMLLRSGSPVPVRPALEDVLNRIGGQRLLGALVFTGPDPALRTLLEQETQAKDAHPFAGEALAALDRYAAHRAGLRQPPRVGRPAADVPTVSAVGHAPSVGLTQRETDVLRELALGGSYVDIAHALYVTENTVKTHIASLYRKLGAERRADALRRARSAGLL
jgi:DNA-binding CsgD family transcriptional regulator